MSDNLHSPRFPHLGSWQNPVGGITAVSLSVLATCGIAFLLVDLVGPSGALLLFLAPVLLGAAYFGFREAALAAMFGVAVTSYFFAEPKTSFVVSDPEHIWAFFVFVMVAGFTTLLSNQIREQKEHARLASFVSEQVYNFSLKIAYLNQISDLLREITREVHLMLNAPVYIVMPVHDGHVDAISRAPQVAPDLGPENLNVARKLLMQTSDQPALLQTNTVGSYWFEPMMTGRGCVAVLVIGRKANSSYLERHQRLLLDACANHAAITIEHSLMSEKIEEARLIKETEEFRNALLASLTHDFKTPLASILGSISSLRQYGDLYDERARSDLLENAQSEAEHLNKYINNLLDITRLDCDALPRDVQAADASDLIGSAVRRIEKQIVGQELKIHVADELPMFKMNFGLAEQALYNLLDNAIKYGRADGDIVVSARREGAYIVISVEDDGPGIPEDELAHIFDRFYRIRRRDSQRAGMGLGLAVAKGFVERMGGKIYAGNRAEGGAILTIAFPISAKVH